MHASTSCHRLLTSIGVFAVLAFTAYQAMGTNVFGSRPWPEASVDFHLFYDLSLQIAETKVYPSKHAYPPSAIVLHYLLAQLPYTWAAGLYMVLTILVTMACWSFLLGLVPEKRGPGWLVLVLPALVISEHYLLWDLRSQNCNLIVCACTLAGIYALHRDRPIAAGFWLGLSFSLKLFSVLLIPYLLWRGKIRAFAWAIAFIAFFWLLLPLTVFSAEGMVAIYQDWFRQMGNVGAERADISHPILISLHNAGHLLFGGNLSAIAWFSNGFRAVWIILGILAMFTSWRRRTSQTDGHGLLADVGLLILGPVAVSPYLEVYQAVPFIIPAFLLVETVTDSGQNPRLRLFGLLNLGILLVMRPGIVPFAYRGIPVNLALLLATAAAIFIAAVRRRELGELTRSEPSCLAATCQDKELASTGAGFIPATTLAQLPQLEEKCTDFRALGRRKSLRVKASVAQGAM